jgi:hypothetical protein
MLVRNVVKICQLMFLALSIVLLMLSETASPIDATITGLRLGTQRNSIAPGESICSSSATNDSVGVTR